MIKIDKKFLKFMFDSTDNYDRIAKLVHEKHFSEEDITALQRIYNSLIICSKKINFFEISSDKLKSLICIYYDGNLNNKTFQDVENEYIIKTLVE